MAGEDDIETPPPHNHMGGQVRLPTFWAQAPAMWFAQAECLFELQGVTCQMKKYCYVVASLTHESMRRVSDLVVAAVQEVALDEASINALKQQSKDKSGDNKKEEKSDRQGPSLAARLESGLCHGHWVYGESSTTCHKPCTWQGNGQAGGN